MRLMQSKILFSILFYAVIGGLFMQSNTSLVKAEEPITAPITSPIEHKEHQEDKKEQKEEHKEEKKENKEDKHPVVTPTPKPISSPVIAPEHSKTENHEDFEFKPINSFRPTHITGGARNLFDKVWGFIITFFKR